MSYQPSWVIWCQSHPCRRTEMILFNPKLRDKGVHSFPKGISPKVYVIAWLEFEFTNFEATIFNYLALGLPNWSFVTKKWNCVNIWARHIFVQNGYHHRKWNWWTEFKSGTILFMFLLVQKPMEKVLIHLFSTQLWVNRRNIWDV